MKKLLNLFLLINSLSLFSQNEFKPSEWIYNDENITLAIENSYKEYVTSIPLVLSKKEKENLKKKYDQRREYSKEILSSGLVINKGPVFDFLDSLKNIILEANPDINKNLKIYPVRNLEFNAFTTGDNIIYINLGLLYRTETVEQVLFVICHEIGHNVMDHVRQNYELTIKSIQNDSIVSLLRKHAKKEYGRVTAMNELMFPLISMGRENSRNNEFQADSLGMVYYNRIGLPFNDVKASFKLMKGLEHFRDTLWKESDYNISFKKCGIDLQQLDKHFKGSSLNLTHNDRDTLSTLRTHPFEEDRIKFLEKDYSENTNYSKTSNSKLHWKYYVENEMIYNAFASKKLIESIFYILQADTNYLDKQFSNEILSLSLTILALEKKQRNQGYYIGFINLDHDKIYKDFQSYFRDMSPESCFKLSMCLKPKESQTEYFTLLKTFEYAYLKEKENFSICFEKLDTSKYQWYNQILIDFCKFNKFKCKT